MMRAWALTSRESPRPIETEPTMRPWRKATMVPCATIFPKVMVP